MLRPRGLDSDAIVPNAVAALRYVEGLGHQDPILLAFHPIARMNPYQQLLYGDAWRHGVAPVPLYELDALDDLVALARSTGVPLALHLHWTNKILETASTDAEARTALDTFVRRLDRFRDAGGYLLWTVHNAIPHDSPRPRLDAQLQQAIVDRATLVHVLGADTPSAVKEWFSLPEDRVVHVPHPSYRGAYQDSVSRAQARWELGLEPDDIVYSLLGAIKPYKAIDRLVDAFDAVSHRLPGQRRLIVAGMPDGAPVTERFLELCEIHPFVLLHAARIPAGEMQLFLRASDLVVLPYVRTLNSGVLMLALTFGVPVVAPAVAGIAETLTPAGGITFDPADDDSLRRALVEADRLITPEAQAAARAIADRHDPSQLSAEFARAVAERIARSRAPADRADAGQPALR